MFTNVGWSELLVLGMIALVVLGPERLPEAARWLGSSIRKVKEFAGNAQQQLKEEYGADLDEFSEPIKQLNELRGMTPRALVTKHLLDGDDSLFSGDFDAAAPAGATTAQTPSTGPAPTVDTAQSGPTPTGAAGSTAPTSTPAPGSSSKAPRLVGDPARATAPADGPVWDVDAT